MTIAALLNSQSNTYSERNNNRDRYDKNQYNKSRFRAYVVKKQEENEINNEETENSVKMKNHKSDYYITDLNMNFYDVKVYNQKENKESEVNFVTTAMISCCNYHQLFKFRNILFCYFHFRTVKITCCSMKKTTAKSLTAMLTKSSDKLLKIMSINSVVIIKDIKTDYDFHN